MKVTVNSLSLSYEHKGFGRANPKVLDSINFNLESGNKIALVGPNGSGKSTLLRALMGFLNFEGKILYDDESINSMEVKQKISYVPQLSPYFSSPVKDVVETILKIRNIASELFIQNLNDLELSYEAIKSKPFRDLSGGMKQKLQIGLAFSSHPEIIFLDEPTNSLDTRSRQTFFKLCESLNPNVIFILCSHRLEEIRHIVNHVIELKKGRLSQNGMHTVGEYLERQTSCMIEVLLLEKDRELAEKMGLSHLHSNWWFQATEQSNKINVINKINSAFGERIKNIMIKDIDD